MVTALYLIHLADGGASLLRCPFWPSGSLPHYHLVDQPAVARRRSQPDNGPNDLSPDMARKTWAFFETYVGPDDHWLPPDNYQEHPVARVAHRTSPTNMGLALLANLSAYDFGYLSGGQLIERTGNAFRSMEALERYRGHFYNWYDTQSLTPLLPIYISSVDSGNLAGQVLTLRAGLLALPDQPFLSPSRLLRASRHFPYSDRVTADAATRVSSSP